VNDDDMKTNEGSVVLYSTVPKDGLPMFAKSDTDQSDELHVCEGGGRNPVQLEPGSRGQDQVAEHHRMCFQPSGDHPVAASGGTRCQTRTTERDCSDGEQREGACMTIDSMRVSMQTTRGWLRHSTLHQC
jgi:hypothetical protein